MGDVDAGNVKAKASIEYDGSGLKQMKEDLASLSDTLGGGLEQNTQRASDALSGLGESMSGSAGGAKEFSAALDELPKIAEGGTSAVAEMSGVLEEHRAAVEEAGTAYESLQKPVETVTSSLEKAAPAMQVVSEHTRGLNENLSQAQQSFSDLSAAIAEPGATEAYTNLWKSVSGESLGASPLANFEVFQKAYNAIDSSGMYDAAGGMQMIDEHLDKTGQSYEQFAGSLSEKNQQLLHEMSMDWSQINTTMDGAGQSFQKAGEKAQTGFNTITSSAGDADQAVADFLGKTTKGVGELSGGFKPATLGGAFSEVMGGAMNVLNEIAMPLMAAQMIGMAVQQVGQAMYDSAAIAEGPAAHSFGTFTGTVDALGQSLQRTGGQFSESFGQAFLPTLNALNNQAGSSDGGWGGIIGGISSTIANLSLITTGIDPWGGTQGLINQGAQLLGLQQPFQGPGPVAQSQIQYQQQMAALPQTVQQNAQQLQYQSALTMADAVNPTWLAANNEAMASQKAASYLIQDYNIRHPQSQYDIIQNARYNQYAAQQEMNYQQQMAETGGYGPVDFGGFWGGVFKESAGFLGGPDSYFNSPTGSLMWGALAPTSFIGNIANKGGIGNWLSGMTSPAGDILSGIFGGHSPSLGDVFGGIGNWFQGLFGGGDTGTPAGPVPISAGGCFVAGTPVLLADGRSKAIELLRVDERVLAYDGEKQVPATIIGCIMFPAKQTYKLTFSDGNTLVTTDSHPIATPQGWKSISPESTAQENPGLPVTVLAVGDSIYTVDGTLCRLTSIQRREIAPVYNITVDASHTYYAAGILVHNAKQGNIGSMTNGGVGSEQVQLSHTFTANIQWEANNLQKQFTGSASWAAQGLTNTFQGAASWVAQGLTNTFQGATTWVAQGLTNTFQGIANWVAQGGLEHTFEGIANWISQGGLEHTFEGIANWVAQGGLEHTFKGMANWAASGLEHTFNAVANWTAQNLTPNFTVNPSFTMLAEGTSNWGGGPAIVGEGGAPEVVEHNGQYSLIDHATLLDLPSGANVYPMKNLQNSGVAQFADGTGNVIPLNIGLKGGNNNAPESVNIYLQVDGQTFWSATGVSLAQGERLTSGNRSY